MSDLKNEMVQLLARYGHVGFTFVACIFIGLGAGIYLDQKVFDGDTAPWLTFIGLAFGIAAGFKNLLEILWRYSDDQDNDPPEQKKKVSKEFVSLQKMQVISWVYLAVLTVGSGVVWSWNVAWSVFAGGVISIVSFTLSQRGLQRFFKGLTLSPDEVEKDPGAVWKKSGYLVKFWVRIAIIGVVLLLLIKSGRASILGLILGLSTVVFTITLTAVDVVRHYYFSGRR